MSERRDHFDISPKTERAWKPKGPLDFEIPKEPSAEWNAPDIKPSEEKLTVPDRRASTVPDRGRSFGFSLALHLALGAAWLSVPDRHSADAKEPDPTHLRGERQIEALGDTVRARILRAAEMAERNREVLERLRKERHDYYDRAIEAFLDPESREYERRLGIPPIEAFAQIDAMLKAEKLAKSVTTERLDEEHTRQLVREYKENLLTRHRENMAILLRQDYVWTGNARRDFPTLQQALFQGPNRYFHNPGLPDTKYQKDHDRFDEQIETGVVNCQVARMTPMVLAEIYEQRGLPKEDLRNTRAVVWNDHVFSGYEDPHTQNVFTLMEGSFRTPEWVGTHPPSAEDPGRLLPVGDHLAYYLLQHDATEDQHQRLAELGYDHAALGTFSSEPLPTETVDFGTYEEIVAGDKTAAETLRQRLKTEREYEPTKDVQKQLDSFIFFTLSSSFDFATQADPPYGAFITLPQWVRSEAVREYIRRRGLPPSLDYHVDHDVYRTLLMDGEHSRELLEQALDKAYENAQAQFEIEKSHGRTSPGSMASTLLFIDGVSPLGTKVVYRFKDEPWFDPALEELIHSKIEIIRRILKDDTDSFFLNVHAEGAIDTIDLFERLAREYEQEHGKESRNPFRRKAERLKTALEPYQEHFGVNGFTFEQIKTLSEEDLRRAIDNNPRWITHMGAFSMSVASRHMAALQRISEFPDLYISVLEQIVESRETVWFHRLSIHARYIELALAKQPERAPEFRAILKSAIQKALSERLPKDKTEVVGGEQTILSDLLSLHHDHPWLRGTVEEILREAHAKRPFTDFDIYYAGLERFGITPSKTLEEIRTHEIQNSLYEDADSNDFFPLQHHISRNGAFDALFLQSYLQESRQSDRLYLLQLFWTRFHLPPPVGKDQLYQEDLALIQALPASEKTGSGVVFVTRFNTDALHLKPFYAPETIDLKKELRLNPEHPDLEQFEEWAKMNPDLGFQYVAQWLAFQDE